MHKSATRTYLLRIAQSCMTMPARFSNSAQCCVVSMSYPHMEFEHRVNYFNFHTDRTNLGI